MGQRGGALAQAELARRRGRKTQLTRPQHILAYYIWIV